MFIVIIVIVIVMIIITYYYCYYIAIIVITIITIIVTIVCTGIISISIQYPSHITFSIPSIFTSKMSNSRWQTRLSLFVHLPVALGIRNHLLEPPEIENHMGVS